MFSHVAVAQFLDARVFGILGVVLMLHKGTTCLGKHLCRKKRQSYLLLDVLGTLQTANRSFTFSMRAKQHLLAMPTLHHRLIPNLAVVHSCLQLCWIGLVGVLCARRLTR